MHSAMQEVIRRHFIENKYGLDPQDMWARIELLASELGLALDRGKFVADASTFVSDRPAQPKTNSSSTPEVSTARVAQTSEAAAEQGDVVDAGGDDGENGGDDGGNGGDDGENGGDDSADAESNAPGEGGDLEGLEHADSGADDDDQDDA